MNFSLNLTPASAGFLYFVDLLFDHEDAGHMFLPKRCAVFELQYITTQQAALYTATSMKISNLTSTIMIQRTLPLILIWVISWWYSVRSNISFGSCVQIDCPQ
jgi:hypothetical protein